MGRLLRRIRGTLGMALTWSIPWAVIGAVLGGALLFAVARSSSGIPFGGGDLLRMWLTGTMVWGGWGFATGIFFSLALAGTRGRDRLYSMGLVRFASLGAVAGVVPPLVIISYASVSGGVIIPAGAWVVIAVGAGLGAVSAAASLWVARAGVAASGGGGVPPSLTVSVPGQIIEGRGPDSVREAWSRPHVRVPNR